MPSSSSTPLRLRRLQRLGVDADAGADDVGIGEPRSLEVGLDTGAELGQRPVRQAPHVGPRRLVADHDRVRLGAVDQAKRHAGVGGVEERALPLDQVPVIRLVLGREPLGGAGDEVGHHRIDRDPAARDEDSGLPGRAEAAGDAAPAPFGVQCEGGVHLADRGVGAHREQALAGPLHARAHGELLRRMAHVEEMPAVRLGSIAHRWQVAKPHMKPAGDVEARFERRHEGGESSSR